MLQETAIPDRMQGMHMAGALQEKGYMPFFDSRLLETASTLQGRGGLLRAFMCQYLAEHEVLSFTEIVRAGTGALVISTDKGGLTLINVKGPEAGSSPCTW